MKCDKCRAKVRERFQCGDQWVCGPCMPKDRIAMYKGWNPKEKK